MKILIISNMYPSKQKPYSGLFVLNQIEALKQELPKNDILDFYYMKRTFTNKLGSILKYVKFFLNFIFFIRDKKMKYDIIHIHYYFPTIYIALIYKYFFNKKVKIIVTFHGGDFYGKNHNFIYKYPMKFIDFAISVSSALNLKLNKYINPSKTFVISAGINNIFSSINIEKKYDILYVGSFFFIKGFDNFCQSIEKINIPLNICVVGSGKLKSLLNKVKNNTIHNITLYENKSQNELIEIYNSSKFLLNTSRKEGFGLVLSEAMACGVIPIATKTDGAIEQIRNKENGFLIEIGEDDKSTIKNIVKIINFVINLTDKQLKPIIKEALEYGNTQKLSKISFRVIEIYKDIDEK